MKKTRMIAGLSIVFMIFSLFLVYSASAASVTIGATDATKNKKILTEADSQVSLSGLASGISGLASVKVAIGDEDGNYWDESVGSFVPPAAGSSEIWNNANINSSTWSYSFGRSALTLKKKYLVRAYAVDSQGNITYGINPNTGTNSLLTFVYYDTLLIKIDSPVAGAFLYTGKEYPIKWSGLRSDEPVSLAYVKSGTTTPNKIIIGKDSAGNPLYEKALPGSTFLWPVTQDMIGDGLQVTLVLAGNTNIEIPTSGAFSVNAPRVFLHTPDPAELYRNDTYNITWDRYGLNTNTVDITYDQRGDITPIDSGIIFPVSYPGTAFSLSPSVDAAFHPTTAIGYLGKAAIFDRQKSDYIKVNHAPALNPDTGKVTVEAWVQPRSLIAADRVFNTLDYSQVAADDTYLYIIDTNDNRIVKLNKSDLSFDSEIIYLKADQTESMQNPVGITVDAGDGLTGSIYVTDTGGQRILKINKADNFDIVKNGTYGNPPAAFPTLNLANPAQVAVDTANKFLYVSDKDNARVIKLKTDDLIPVASYGRDTDPNFGAAWGIAVDKNSEETGFVYVLDRYNVYVVGTNSYHNHRIVKLKKSDLSFVAYSDYAPDRPTSLIVSGNSIYISETNAHRIVKLDTSLSSASAVIIGSQGTGDANFTFPAGIACDDKYFYINDSGNNRVVKRLLLDGSFVSKTGGSGSLVYIPRGYYDIGVDSQNVYLVDYRNRVVKMPKLSLSYFSSSISSASGSGINGLFGIGICPATLDDPQNPDPYIYLASSWGQRILKMKKTDLSIPANGYIGAEGDRTLVTFTYNPGNCSVKNEPDGSQPILHYPNDVAADKDYLYVSDQYNHRLLKLVKSTGAISARFILNSNATVAYADGARGVAVDDTYLYYTYGSKTYKLDKATFTNPVTNPSGTSSSSGGGIACDDTYVYVATGTSTKRIAVLRKTDLTLVKYIGNSAGDSKPPKIDPLDQSSLTYTFTGPNGVDVDWEAGYIYAMDGPRNTSVMMLKSNTEDGLVLPPPFRSSNPCILSKKIGDKGYSLEIVSDDITAPKNTKFRFVLSGPGGAVYSLAKLPVTSGGYETAITTDGTRWYYLAGTYDGNTMNFYVGDERGYIASIGKVVGDLGDGLTAAAGSLVFGADAAVDNNHFKGFFTGLIDEAAIWNRALSQGEIRGDTSFGILGRFNNGLGAELNGNESGLVAAYHFNELNYQGIENEVSSGVSDTCIWPWQVGPVIGISDQGADVELGVSQNGTAVTPSGLISIKQPKLAFTQLPPSSIQAGNSYNLEVKIQKADNSTVTGDNYTQVSLFAEYGGVPHLLSTVPADKGIANFYNVKLEDKASTIKFVATADPICTEVSSDPIAVTGAALDHYGINISTSSIDAGTSRDFTVEALDMYGNRASSSGGYKNKTLRFSSSDPQAVKPNDFYVSNNDNSGGIWSFPNGSYSGITFKTRGAQTLTVTAGTFSGTSAAVPVKSRAAQKLMLSSEDTSVPAGTSMKLNVKILDEYGNEVTDNNLSSPITVSLASNDSTASGKFYSDFAAANEISQLSIPVGTISAPVSTTSKDFYYKQTQVPSGTSVTVNITANNASLPQGSATVPLTITSLSASKLVFATEPASIEAGQVSGAFSVVSRDSLNNNTIISANDTILNLVSSSATTKFYSNAAGTTEITSIKISGNGTISANFYIKDTKAGSQTITATAPDVTPSLTAAQTTKTVAPAAAKYFKIITDPASESSITADAGVPIPIAITAYDGQGLDNGGLGNVSTVYTGFKNLIFSGLDPSPAPASRAPTCNDINFGTATPITFNQGIATAVLKLYKVDLAIPVIKVKVGTTITTKEDADGLSVILKHAAADHLRFTSDIPASVDAGVAFSLPALNAMDAYDNLCDDANGATPYNATTTIDKYIIAIEETNDPLNYANSWPVTSVAFSNGVSTTPLDGNILYRAQKTTITPRALGKDGAPSSEVTVKPGEVARLSFIKRDPADLVVLSPSAIVNIPFTIQPTIAVADQYSNPVPAATGLITLQASLTRGSYTAASGLRGTLTAALSEGKALFNGINCSNIYLAPDGIYLMAKWKTLEQYSDDKVSISTGVEGTIEAGTSIQEIISGDHFTSNTKLEIFNFKVIDGGNDSTPIKIEQIIINRDPAVDTTGGWKAFFDNGYVTISDGTKMVPGTVINDKITFGDLNTTMFEVADGDTQTFTVSLYLKTKLPEDADGKVIAFSINPNEDTNKFPARDIVIDSNGSSFITSPALPILSNSSDPLKVEVKATKFQMSGPTEVTAGASGSLINLKATDINGNVDLGYGGGKTIVFSGADVALDGVSIPSIGGFDFGTPTSISFVNGNSSSYEIKLYKAGNTAIIAKEYGDFPGVIIDSDTLNVLVRSAAYSNLSWAVPPVDYTVANAPWKPFSIQLSDAYGNLTSSSGAVTIAVQGGQISSGANASVNANGGLATFSNFAVDCATYPGAVKITASAAGTPSIVYPEGSSTITVADKYTVNIKVLDSVSGERLDEVAMEVSDSSGAAMPDYNQTQNGLFTLVMPYNTYSFSFTKTAYVAKSVTKSPNPSADGLDGKYDNNITWTMFIESVAESLSDYHVLSNFVYDENSDQLAANVRLERRGKLVLSDEIRALKKCTLAIYDNESASTANAAVYSTEIDGAPTAPDGNYWLYIDNAVASGRFTSGKSYFVKLTVTYGGIETTAVPVTYSAVNTFSIPVTEKLKSWISAELGGQLATTAQSITKHAETQTAAIKEHVSTEAGKITKDITETMKPQLSQILTATGGDKGGATLPEQIKAAQEKIESGILNRETSIKIGSTMTISYRTKSGLSPVLYVYDPKGVQKVAAKAMKEGTATEDGYSIYTYNLKFENQWGIGDFSVVCSEQSLGTADAVVISVVRHDLEEVSGQVSGILGTTSSLTGLGDIVDTLNSQFGLIEKALGNLGQGISGEISKTKGVVNDLESVYNQLTSLSGQIKKIGGTQGVSLEKLYNVSKDKKDDITYLKNKAQELKATMEINQKMMQNVANKPVVQSWFEFK